MRNRRVKLLVEIALIGLMSPILGMVKVWEMPQGGSVSLEMLPIIVLALVEGVGPGVLAGLLAGTIGCILNPQVVHPVQFLLDYPLAYGAVGLAGLFSPAWRRQVQSGHWARATWTAVLPAIVVAAIARYPMHVLSGYVFFASFAPKDQPVLAYSMLYNSFVFVAAGVCFVCAAAVLPALARAPFVLSQALTHE